MSADVRAVLYVGIGLLLLFTLVFAITGATLLFETEDERRYKAKRNCPPGASQEVIEHEMTRVMHRSDVAGWLWAGATLVFAAATALLCIYTHYQYNWFAGRALLYTLEVIGVVATAVFILDATEDKPRWRWFWLGLLALMFCCSGTAK